jgi:hypothetical protein
MLSLRHRCNVSLACAAQAEENLHRLLPETGIGSTAMMEFVNLATRPDIPTYGAIGGEFSFVITFLTEGGDRFHASVKKLGAQKFDGTRIDLGHFKRFADAAKACEIYLREHQQ